MSMNTESLRINACTLKASEYKQYLSSILHNQPKIQSNKGQGRDSCSFYGIPYIPSNEEGYTTNHCYTSLSFIKY